MPAIALVGRHRGAATVAPGPELVQNLARDLAAAADYAAREKAASTRRAYASDWRAFTTWCAARGVPTLPAEPAAVAAFLAAEADAGRQVRTLARRCAAIRYAHRLQQLPTPTDAEAVRATLRGIRRTVGTAPRQKAPATTDVVLALVHHAEAAIAQGRTLEGRRDRALLLLGFAGAFRRSELAALTVADLEEVPQGLRVHVRRAKTDQEGAGAVVAVLRGRRAQGRYCPVAAVRAWLDAAGITAGPVFRPLWKGGVRAPQRVRDTALSAHAINRLVQAYAARAGYDPTAFGGHSLRAGFLTAAAERGANVFRLLDVSRHRSVDTLRAYVRRAEQWTDHAGAGLL